MAESSAVDRPTTTRELQDCIADAARTGAKLEIRGGGSKCAIGAPRDGLRLLDMRGFSGVIDYDPAELVLTVGAGTPLAEVQELVETRGQMLAFDPFDHGPLFGDENSVATIGGVIAAGVAGSQRLSQGGARDHFLGFQAVSGRGEAFVAGGKVVKNVTGYDLPKLLAASWGRLAALTEITLKVLPSPRAARTLIFEGLEVQRACEAMSLALRSPADVAAAAYVPAGRSRRSLTAFRLQGFLPSVAARAELIQRLLSGCGVGISLDETDASVFWVSLTAPDFDPVTPLWRLSVPPSAGAPLAAFVSESGGKYLMDWGGGLVWASTTINASAVRAAVARHGGHAMLVRAPEEMRRTVCALHPPEPAIARLEERVRRAFDPVGVFETGRF